MLPPPFPSCGYSPFSWQQDPLGEIGSVLPHVPIRAYTWSQPEVGRGGRGEEGEEEGSRGRKRGGGGGKGEEGEEEGKEEGRRERGEGSGGQKERKKRMSFSYGAMRPWDHEAIGP